MAIISKPVTRDYESGFDEINWDKKQPELFDTQIRVRRESNDEGTMGWLATCAAYPTIQVWNSDPTAAYNEVYDFIHEEPEAA